METPVQIGFVRVPVLYGGSVYSPDGFETQLDLKDI